MNTCTTCGHPVNRGGGYSQHLTRCLICRTNDLMRGWRYPASTIGQRKLRERKNTHGKGRNIQGEHRDQG